MLGFYRGLLLAGGLAAAAGGQALAQENLDAGKTPAQLYASDCAICHKSPQGLSKNAGVFGLSSFLREHYTSSRESAAAIAAYVQSVDTGPAGPAPKKPAKRTAKGDDKGKAGEGKLSDKPGDAKSAGSKSGDTKSGDAKASETKSGGEPPKTGDAKPGEVKSTDSKPAESKPTESKPAESKAAEPKPAAKDAGSGKKSD
jgi:hypothetical protein